MKVRGKIKMKNRHKLTDFGILIALLIMLTVILGGCQKADEPTVPELKSIVFGRYEQDNNLTNGPEPIEWTVLEEKDGRSKLISKHILDFYPYHLVNSEVDWQDCHLRVFLNRDFRNTAFTADERSMLLFVDPGDASAEQSPNAAAVADQVTMLSEYEATELYFRSDRERQCTPTRYLIEAGIIQSDKYKIDDTGTCEWRLRSSGRYVGFSGRVSDASVSYSGIGFRPVICLNIKDGVPVPAVQQAQAAPADEKTAPDEIDMMHKTVIFGHYEEDNDPDNGTEPIEWTVLDTRAGKCLLISRYGLDAVAYHPEETGINWEECELRTWLNDTFFHAAFTDSERAAILPTKVDNSKKQGRSDYRTNGGNDTEDLVFLLSVLEVSSYFDSQNDRRAYPTVYAEARGAVGLDTQNFNGSSSGQSRWWLRSPGSHQENASVVNHQGILTDFKVNRDFIMARPAIWVRLDAIASSFE